MSAPLLTDEQIASVCLSYRHDFGLLEDGDRHRLMFTAREWERAMSHEIRAPLLAEIERLTVDSDRVKSEFSAFLSESNQAIAFAIRAVERLTAERDAAMADAERYRWLRNNCSGEPRIGDHAPTILLFGLQGRAEEVWNETAVATNHLTDTIDAARSAT